MTSKVSPKVALPTLLDSARLRLRGELHDRVILSVRRITALYPDLNDYTPETKWPGDRSGRIIEALSVVSHYLGERPARLDELIELVPGRLNAHGYVGPIVGSDELHTDQLWGNWFHLLGLLAYWDLTADSRALALARDIADELFLPRLSKWDPYHYDFHWYPWRPDRWTLSVHPGAGFASGGGLVHLYSATGDVRYLEAARTVAELFMKYNWREGAHGHSALSGLVNLVDLYVVTGERRYLEEAIDGHRWVGSHVISPNGEPFNLFHANDTYMEGCGVGDWLVLNLKLWRTTGDATYLDVAEGVLYNALFHVQRPSGSFGCDARELDGISSHPRFFEADWCCTMRGSRALSELLRYIYTTDSGNITVNFYASGEATLTPWGADGPRVRVVQETDYPEGGTIALTISPDQPSDFAVRLRIPHCALQTDLLVNDASFEATYERGYLVVRRKWVNGDRCLLRLRIGLRAYAAGGFPAQHAGSGAKPTAIEGLRFYHGPLVLGADTLHNDAAALSAAGLLLLPHDGDDIILPSRVDERRPNPFRKPAAHYAAVVLRAAEPTGFSSETLTDQAAILRLSPLSEHTGDPQFGVDTRVRFTFRGGLFRDPNGQQALATMLSR